jgi:hypothetical protein
VEKATKYKSVGIPIVIVREEHWVMALQNGTAGRFPDRL